MAKVRCLKKTFQESLEDIKERMKEKRMKKLAKVVTVKAYSAKAMKINNSSVSVKSIQENNKGLALALEEEKVKSRQAQDLILHLKREHQRLMFEIFMLRRKLSLHNGRESTNDKLSSLKDIIAKVTSNLLETAKLLGPAQVLCTSNNIDNTPSVSEKPLEKYETIRPLCRGLPQHAPASNSSEPSMYPKESGRNDENLNCEDNVFESSEKITSTNKGRRSHIYQPGFISEEVNLVPNEKPERIAHLHRNVSTRRPRSNLNSCREEPVFQDRSEVDCLNADYVHSGTENIAPVEDCNFRNNGGMENLDTFPSPSKEEFLPDSEINKIASSTPEIKTKDIPAKSKEDSRTGRERVRKGKTDKAGSVPLKKPWENSKPRARSKSRERGTSKHLVSNEKMNSSLNSGDAYDFAFEESVHVTPFRQNKPEEEDLNENSSVESNNEDDMDDSLYVPHKENSKNKNRTQSSISVPLRPRSKRSKAIQPQKKENKKEVQEEQVNLKKNGRNGLKVKTEHAVETSTDVLTETVETTRESFLPTYEDAEDLISNPFQLKVSTEKLHLDTNTPTERILGCAAAEPPTPRFSLSDVTNLSGCSDVKKRSCPLHNSDERKKHGTPIRKRRCTVTVNYAEPKLSAKLRRGDPFTDTEFLNSPIYKQKDARKSLKKNSLSRYNEAFVGCSR
ncbi:shugoshin 1 isoform X1 [Pelobates cultripes]|uniref:Shugoshin 1 isoform X1 n=1 Tax=Pelobates cultripes TaxID=61616 RepID=A0AAD1RYF0_PELCU|nr:shugoshin 1 isoform X1 [Pelobates cultripes]